jgi:hypothetical protein
VTREAEVVVLDAAAATAAMWPDRGFCDTTILWKRI